MKLPRLHGNAYLNGNAIMNVVTGTMLTKAQAKVAEVYWIPRRKKYCVIDALQESILYIFPSEKAILRNGIPSQEYIYG